MITTQEIKIQAAKPNMPLNPFVAFKDSPSSVRIMEVPKRIGNWNIDKVNVQVTYPDGSIQSKECVRTGNVWVGTVKGTETIGTVEQGYQITASGTDEDGNAVDGYVLGVGDVCIMQVDGQISPSITATNIRLYNRDEAPEHPKTGDAYFDDYDGSYCLFLCVEGFDFYVQAGYTDISQCIKYGDNNVGLIPKHVTLKSNTDKYFTALRHHQIDVSDGDKASTTIQHNNIVIGGPNTTLAKLVLADGSITLQSNHQGDGKYNSIIYLNGVRVLNRTEVENSISTYVDDNVVGKYMPINGKETGLFRLGTQSSGIEWSTKGGYLGVYGPNSIWFDENAFMELETGWDQLKKIVSHAGKQEVYETLPEYLSANYALSSNVKNSTIKITQGGVEKGSFTLNQDTDGTIALDAGGGGGTEMVFCMVGSRDIGSGDGDAQIVVNKKPLWIGSTRCITALPKKVTAKWTTSNSGQKNKVYLNNVLVPDGNEMQLNDGDEIILEYGRCLEAHTLIAMADGTTKMVCELKVGDKVLSLNPDTLQLEEDEVSDCDAGMMKTHNEMDIWTFADGTTIKTIHPHQFFNIRTNKMEYITDFQIGDGVRKQDGTTTTLIGHETQYGTFYHNTLFTKKFNNYFANGILTGNRYSAKWGWQWIENNA